MEFTSKQNGECLVVEVAGRMDGLTAPEFETAFAGYLEQGAITLAVGMSGVDYISSAGLRSILSTAKKLKAADGQMRFFGLSGMVADVFSVSGFTSIFKLFETEDEAVKG